MLAMLPIKAAAKVTRNQPTRPTICTGAPSFPRTGILASFVPLRERPGFTTAACRSPSVSVSKSSSSVPNPPSSAEQKVKLSHCVVVKPQAKLGRDVRDRELRERQRDVQADGLRADVVGAAVRGFHEAGAAARHQNDTAVVSARGAAAAAAVQAGRVSAQDGL